MGLRQKNTQIKYQTYIYKDLDIVLLGFLHKSRFKHFLSIYSISLTQHGFQASFALKNI